MLKETAHIVNNAAEAIDLAVQDIQTKCTLHTVLEMKTVTYFRRASVLFPDEPFSITSRVLAFKLSVPSGHLLWEDKRDVEWRVYQTALLYPATPSLCSYAEVIIELFCTMYPLM
jgi:hypothetical protein